MKSSKTIVENYMHREDWRVNENSNSPYSFGGLGKYIIGEVAKDYWLREVYPEHIAKEYVEGAIHIHDLSSLSLYCCGYSLQEILMKGVRGIPTAPTSAPAKHLDSILNQVSNLITIFQNEIAGAVAFNSVDTLLAPFIKKDRLTYKEVYQSLQNFIFSVNSNSRAGSEAAFSNITCDLTPPADLIDNYVTIGGELQSFTYRSCQQEMDMFNKALCEIMIKGDSAGKLFGYPIITYNIHERFDWDNPNNKLLWEMAGKFGVPYFANFLGSDMDVGDIRSMAFLPSQNFIYRNCNGDISINEIRHLVKQWKKNPDTQYEILMDGKFVKVVDMFEVPYDKFDKYISIQLANGYTQSFSEQHKCLIQRDGKQFICESQDLQVGDFFVLSSNAWNNNNNIGTYDSGKVLGYYLAEGWFNNHSKKEICYCINENRQDIIKEICQYWEQLGCKCILKENANKHSFNIYVHGHQAVGFVTNFIDGKTALTKKIKPCLWNTSDDFRRGVYDGYYQTDGCPTHQIFAHTTNKLLADDLIILASSLGLILKYRKNDKNTRYFDNQSEKEIFTSYELKESQYSKNQAGQYLVPITDITSPNKRCNTLYNFTVDTPDHLVELPNGIITHQCCRLSLNLKELRKKNGGLFGSGDSTGSIGVTTINLPRLGYLSKTKDEFYKNLSYLLDICSESLEIKRKWLEENAINQTPHYLPAFDEYVGTIDNHFSTIGIVGTNEMCENFFGKNILAPECQEFVEEMYNFIRQRLVELQEKTGHLYNFEATPAEGTCHRLAISDKKKYPDIIARGEEGSWYYTNSCHIPVSEVRSINDTFKHQEKFQVKFTGGTVIHIFLEGAISGEQAKSIIRTVCEQYKVPYVSLSPISRYCTEHSYIKELVDDCPYCHQPLDKYQRITGYLRNTKYYNKGKKAEFKERVQLSGL